MKRLQPANFIMPRWDEFPLACGSCGNQEFSVHIKPKTENYCRVTELVCSNCKKWIKLDQNSMLQGHAKKRNKEDLKWR